MFDAANQLQQVGEVEPKSSSRFFKGKLIFCLVDPTISEYGAYAFTSERVFERYRLTVADAIRVAARMLSVRSYENYARDANSSLPFTTLTAENEIFEKDFEIGDDLIKRGSS